MGDQEGKKGTSTGRSLAIRSSGGLATRKIQRKVPTPDVLKLSIDVRSGGGKGIEIFRSWVSNQPGGTIDISGAPLQGALLGGINLEGATMIQVGMAGVDITGSDLRGVIAPRFVGTGGRFRGVNFTGGDFRDSVWTNSDCTGAKFTGCDLTNAIFSGADVANVIFAGAILKGAYLVGLRNWDKAIWEYAVLNGAMFSPDVAEEVLRMSNPT